MVSYKYNLESGSVKKIDDLGYGWAMYLAKFDNDGHPFNMTFLTKNSKIVFGNKFFLFHRIFSKSGEDLTGQVTPNQFVKNIGIYSMSSVPIGYVQHTVPSTVLQKFNKLNYFPDY